MSELKKKVEGITKESTQAMIAPPAPSLTATGSCWESVACATGVLTAGFARHWESASWTTDNPNSITRSALRRNDRREA